MINYSFKSLSLCLLACIGITGCASNTSGTIVGIQEGSYILSEYDLPTLPNLLPPLESSHSEDDKWGALAYSDAMAVLDDEVMPIIFGFGLARNYATAQEAEQAALRICENDGIEGCQIRAVFQRQCFASVYAPQVHAYAWAIDGSENQASEKAQVLCQTLASGQSCISMSTFCPNTADMIIEPPLASTSPEASAWLSHRFAVYALKAAELRDQGISYEQALEILSELSQEPLDEYLTQQVKISYGLLRNYSPEQIYRFIMFATLYTLMEN